MEKENKGYENLEVWKRSSNLCVAIIKTLGSCKDYELKSQLIKSAISIPSNISEGYERRTNKEFINFLGYAKGSAGELKTQIQIAGKVGTIKKEKAVALLKEAQEINSMLQGLINYQLKKVTHN